MEKDSKSTDYIETALKKAFIRKQVPIVSPLRYPGSKRRLAGYIQKIMEMNSIYPRLFVEPFAGGASVSLQLLKNGAVGQIGLIEKDPLVAAFWRTVFFDADWLVDQVENIEVTLDKWKEFKAGKPRTRRDRAITCLFLNRTSFSGIIAPRVGPIGGWEQKSIYTIDCRFPRETLIKRIRQAEELKDGVAFIWNRSWEAGIGRVREHQARKKLSKDVCFYFDPPFFEKAEQLYTFYFQDDDHIALRNFISGLKDAWLLSYDSVDKVRELYKDVLADTLDIEILYSSAANAGSKASQEVILTNFTSSPAETRLWRSKEEWKFKNGIEVASKSPLLQPV